jgi:DNA-directed RNA polymerase specialized sigma24 family protein
MTETTWWMQIDDPLDRYHRAGLEQQAAEALVTRMTNLRARCLAELNVDGWSYGKIARETGLSRARVQQLVERGIDVVP